MSRPRVPLTTFEREHARRIRKVAAIVFVAGLVIAAVAAALGELRLSAVSAAAAMLYLAAGLIAPLRVVWMQVLLYALIPVVALSLFGYPIVGAVIGAAFGAWVFFPAVRQLRAVPATLRPLDTASVDPEAAANVAAFEALGFEGAGAYAFDPVPGKTVVATVLLGPKGDEYAVVTDLVMDVMSTFGRRWLLTRNSASASIPPEYLSNDLRGAEPAELVDAHRRGLELLGARGLRPDAIAGERLLEIHLESERRCCEWALRGPRARTAKGLFTSGLGAGALDESPSSLRRIDAWLTLPSPAV